MVRSALPDVLAIVGLLALVIAIGMLARLSPPAFDARLAAILVVTGPSWLAASADLIGSLPVVAVVGLGLVAVSAIRGRWRDAAAAGLGLAAEIPTELLKVVIDRPRPPTAHEIEAFGSIASYPSGHVVRTVVVGGLLASLLFRSSRRLRLSATFVAGAVGGFVAFGRVGAGAHWPTDVIGGILLGSAWLSIALAVSGSRTRS